MIDVATDNSRGQPTDKLKKIYRVPSIKTKIAHCSLKLHNFLHVTKVKSHHTFAWFMSASFRRSKKPTSNTFDRTASNNTQLRKWVKEWGGNMRTSIATDISTTTSNEELWYQALPLTHPPLRSRTQKSITVRTKVAPSNASRYRVWPKSKILVNGQIQDLQLQSIMKKLSVNPCDAAGLMASFRREISQPKGSRLKSLFIKFATQSGFTTMRSGVIWKPNHERRQRCSTTLFLRKYFEQRATTGPLKPNAPWTDDNAAETHNCNQNS